MSRDMSRDGATDSIVALNAALKTRDAEYSSSQVFGETFHHTKGPSLHNCRGIS
jgi:hypothetical protein